jgi:hypothetical protein
MALSSHHSIRNYLHVTRFGGIVFLSVNDLLTLRPAPSNCLLPRGISHFTSVMNTFTSLYTINFTAANTIIWYLVGFQDLCIFLNRPIRPRSLESLGRSCIPNTPDRPWSLLSQGLHCGVDSQVDSLFAVSTRKVAKDHNINAHSGRNSTPSGSLIRTPNPKIMIPKRSSRLQQLVSLLPPLQPLHSLRMHLLRQLLVPLLLFFCRPLILDSFDLGLPFSLLFLFHLSLPSFCSRSCLISSNALGITCLACSGTERWFWGVPILS